ncbi:cyclase family protein [Brevibacillus fulvus]|uniref:Kynurenine formamidase n=1 Tax=Brevibacillus fulvus TaxID=1125967 RepID=A0A939BQL1_9BACL|nr:cyclase family protein [Brevibacillus fulvus]MBM7588483.1 arylformamidase [Brevibacillus fulvus]
MYKVYDVSAAIHADMAVYKNKPEKKPQIRVVQDFDTAAARESRADLDMHTGTHVDSPLHMVPGGGTVATLPLDKLVGPCRVLDLTHVQGGITRNDLQGLQMEKDEILVLKTKNSLVDHFDPDFVYLAEDGAKYLAEIGIRSVAIDALGIERSQPGHPTHKTLFEAGIVIFEGLRLAEVPAGNYFFVGAPIKLLETEAAPARVLLFEGLSY